MQLLIENINLYLKKSSEMLTKFSPMELKQLYNANPEKKMELKDLLNEAEILVDNIIGTVDNVDMWKSDELRDLILSLEDELQMDSVKIRWIKNYTTYYSNHSSKFMKLRRNLLSKYSRD